MSISLSFIVTLLRSSRLRPTLLCPAWLTLKQTDQDQTYTDHLPHLELCRSCRDMERGASMVEGYLGRWPVSVKKIP